MARVASLQRRTAAGLLIGRQNRSVRVKAVGKDVYIGIETVDAMREVNRQLLPEVTMSEHNVQYYCTYSNRRTVDNRTIFCIIEANNLITRIRVSGSRSLQQSVLRKQSFCSDRGDHFSYWRFIRSTSSALD